jgi:adenylate cyclase
LTGRIPNERPGVGAMEDDEVRSPAAPLTILFADISDSSLTYAMRGDTVGYTLANACLQLMEGQVAAARGRVIKRVGDGILALFESTEAALTAAVGIQRALDAPGCMLRAEGIHVRVGVTCGRAVLADGDVYGDIVNVAARLVSHAGPDEIFMSDRAYEELPITWRDSIRLVDQLVLRGRPLRVTVYEYIWNQDSTVPAGVRLRSTSVVLEVTYGLQRFLISPERPLLRIGRAPGNDIAITEERISRYHAAVTLRGDKFFLVDSSTNGTYLHPDGASVLRVSREDVTLGSSGRILPGCEDAQPIVYRTATA